VNGEVKCENNDFLTPPISSIRQCEFHLHFPFFYYIQEGKDRKYQRRQLLSRGRDKVGLGHWRYTTNRLRQRKSRKLPTTFWQNSRNGPAAKQSQSFTSILPPPPPSPTTPSSHNAIPSTEDFPACGPTQQCFLEGCAEQENCHDGCCERACR